MIWWITLTIGILGLVGQATGNLLFNHWGIDVIDMKYTTSLAITGISAAAIMRVNSVSSWRNGVGCCLLGAIGYHLVSTWTYYLVASSMSHETAAALLRSCPSIATLVVCILISVDVFRQLSAGVPRLETVRCVSFVAGSTAILGLLLSNPWLYWSFSWSNGMALPTAVVCVLWGLAK